MYYKLELTMYYYCLWYDKLWGPSQRVVTLLSIAGLLNELDWMVTPQHLKSKTGATMVRGPKILFGNQKRGR